MVRLRPIRPNRLSAHQAYLQSTMVRLRHRKRLPAGEAETPFTIHYGEIKTDYFKRFGVGYNIIYNPLW